jgi:hypothetical protein
LKNEKQPASAIPKPNTVFLEDIPLIYKIAALVDLSLVVWENIGYFHASWLPLGGGQMQQIGLVFVTAYIVTELVELSSGPPRDR